MLVLILALLAIFASPAGAGAEPVFVVTGRGWGHGIGMSQYGARGYALHGWTYGAILAHYYAGSAVGTAQTDDPVQVLLESGRTSLSLSSASGFTVAGRAIASGTYAVTPSPGQVVLTGNGASTALASPATVTPGGTPLRLDGVTYRGLIVLASPAPGVQLAAMNVLGREEYLRGVVPREMPAAWASEALKAQAVAARTYSLAVGGHCVWPADPIVSWPAGAIRMPPTAAGGQSVFCPDTRDQVYGGLSAETIATNSAVQSTAGRIVAYDSWPVAAYFFSTSGGRTAAKADEWGPPSVPYLISVADPYDTLSPRHLWGPGDTETDCRGTSSDCTFTATRVKALLGLDGPARDLRVVARNDSLRVAWLEVTDGKTGVRLTGTDARAQLGLRSTWFYVGALSVTPSAARITYGRPVTLTGLTRRGATRGWRVAKLQQRLAGQTAWTVVKAPLPDGAWTITRRPRRAMDYRVVSGNARGQTEHVAVRTKVTMSAPGRSPTRLRGAIRPAGRGVRVTLHRRGRDGSWTLVSAIRTRAGGRFSFTVSRRPGTYRARADAGTGLLAGSATVTLRPWDTAAHRP